MDKEHVYKEALVIQWALKDYMEKINNRNGGWSRHCLTEEQVDFLQHKFYCKEMKIYQELWGKYEPY